MSLSCLIRGKEKATPGLSGGTGREGDTDWVFSSRGQPIRHGGADFKQSQAFL